MDTIYPKKVSLSSILFRFVSDLAVNIASPPVIVFPAKAGIHSHDNTEPEGWTPAFAGVTRREWHA
jgi:hypothetical protein